MKKFFSFLVIITLCLCINISGVTVMHDINNQHNYATFGAQKVYAKTKSSTLKGMVKYLKAKKLLAGEETKMDASLIGGTSGVKYSDAGIEIYVFDTKSDAYKSLVDTNKVILQDLDIEINVDAINGKFILILDDNAENKEKIIKAFNNY